MPSELTGRWRLIREPVIRQRSTHGPLSKGEDYFGLAASQTAELATADGR